MILDEEKMSKGDDGALSAVLMERYRTFDSIPENSKPQRARPAQNGGQDTH